MENNSWTHPPFFSRHLTLQNLRNINFLLIFSILDGGPRKVNDLLTSPSNQFRDYSIWNRIEKLVPQHWNFAPQTLKTLKTTDQSVFKLDFFVKSGFPKTRDLSPAAPRGVYISRNDPQTNICWSYWPAIKKTSCFHKNGFLFCLFFVGPQLAGLS